MFKKTAMIALAAVVVAAGAVVVLGDAGNASACDGKTKSAAAQASACTKTASAAKVSAASTGTACGSKTKTAGASAACSKTAQAQSACCASMAKQAHYTQVKKVADNIPYRVNTRVVMTGTYTCGSCDLDATEKCQAFLKTADGQLYPLQHNINVKSMYKLHKAGENKFEVTARVAKEGGAKYLDVTHYSAL